MRVTFFLSIGCAKATPRSRLKQLLRASAVAGSEDTYCRARGYSLQVQGTHPPLLFGPPLGCAKATPTRRLEPLLRESAVAGSGDTYRRVRGDSLQGQGVPIFRWCCSLLPSVRVCQDTYVKHSPGTPCGYAPCGALNVLAWGVLRHLPSVSYTSCTQLLLL